MRSLLGLSTLPLALISAVTGCASSADLQGEIESESANADELSGNAGATVEDTYTYFGLAADIRRCPSSAPTCGGWILTDLDRSAMRCHDGQYAKACYASVLEWSGMTPSDEQQIGRASCRERV